MKRDAENKINIKKIKKKMRAEVNTVYQCPILKATPMKFRVVHCVALNCFEFIF